MKELIILIWLAFLLDCIVGDPYWFPHPVRFIGKYINLFNKFIFMKERDGKILKFVWGPLLTVTTVIITYLITKGFLDLSYYLDKNIYYVVTVLIIWTTIAPCCLSKEGYKVYKPLKSGKIEIARKRLSFLVSRDTKNLNQDSIARATVETILENLSDGVIAPLFYCLIGGAPLAMAYKAINTLDSMVGYRNEKFENLGFFSAKTDDFFNLVPARLSGVLLIISAFICGYDFKGALKVFKRDRLNHKSPNSAHPEAAGAGALGIRLGGPNYYFGKVVNKPYIGDEKRTIESIDILRSIKLIYASTIIMLLTISIICLRIS